MPHASGNGRVVQVGDVVFVKSGYRASVGSTSWTGTVEQVFHDLCVCLVEGIHEKPELVLTSRLVHTQMADAAR